MCLFFIENNTAQQYDGIDNIIFRAPFAPFDLHIDQKKRFSMTGLENERTTI